MESYSNSELVVANLVHTINKSQHNTTHSNIEGQDDSLLCKTKTQQTTPQIASNQSSSHPIKLPIEAPPQLVHDEDANPVCNVKDRAEKSSNHPRNTPESISRTPLTSFKRKLHTSRESLSQSNQVCFNRFLRVLILRFRSE